MSANKFIASIIVVAGMGVCGAAIDMGMECLFPVRMMIAGTGGMLVGFGLSRSF